MPSPQFDRRESNYRWFTLTYQSNGVLNEATHHQIKRDIAEILVEKFTIESIHSYIHSNITFSINTDDGSGTLDDLIDKLEEPLANYTPRLRFNIALVAKNPTSRINYMYIDGLDSVDTHFRGSISDIFPE